MNIDVKQKPNGNYFYSFAFEKGVAPQTLLAAVSENNSPTTPENRISQNKPIVKHSIKENAHINEVINSDMTPDEKRVALEERVHFIPRGGKTTQNIVEQAQQRAKSILSRHPSVSIHQNDLFLFIQNA